MQTMDTGQDIERVIERRQKPRQAVDRVAFIQLADGNSGTILDVSETGLRFRAVAPIAANGPVEFWYSMNLSDRVEAKGEVVWRDATRKEGGLCFTNGATNGEGGSAKKKKEGTKTRARKNSSGFAVLGAIPDMQTEAESAQRKVQSEAVIDLTPELEEVETESAARSVAEKSKDIKDIEVATRKVESSDEMTSKPEQRPKPQWKIELEEALARRAAGKVGAEAEIPRGELQENFAPAEETRATEAEVRAATERVAEPRISEPVIPEPVAAQAQAAPEPAARASWQAPPQAAPQAPPQAPYKTPPIPDELFARIAARENERFYMPPMEPAARSSWPFVKGIFAGMLATAAIVAFGFYYLGLQQEKASRNVPPPVEKNGATDPAQGNPLDKDNLQSSPTAAGVLPQNSAPASAGAAPGVAEITPAATPDGKASDPRALAQKQIPSPNINGAVAPSSSAATQVPAGAAAQSQMAQRPGASPVNPASVNSADRVAQNGAVPGTLAKPKPYVKVPRTPEELWMDVAAGNTAAQIMLAQMYAVGDGVGKNCEQARVLLKAAAAKGNAEAIRKYDDINETSCK